MDLPLYGTAVRVAAVYDGRVVQNKLPVLIEEIDTVNDWVSQFCRFR
jgi:stringent starvation protein B